MISRGIAAFIGGFTLLNLVGGLIAPGFDANLWWIDLSPWPWFVAMPILLAGGIALLAYAIHPPRRSSSRWAVAIPVIIFLLAALANSARYYVVLHRHLISTTVPIPFSGTVCATLAIVAWRILRPGAMRKIAQTKRVAISTFIICLVAFPLAQIYFFGHTDYRRKADAIVVFGARAYADGSASGILADRVLTGCELYRDGLADKIIFSGGPGDGAIDEPEAMRRLALENGIPASAIQLDHDGLNTDATVRNTRGIFRQEHISRVLAVSHYYHLPRIKMAYRQYALDVYTVPVSEQHLLPRGGPLLIAREVAALWAYYLHPLRR